MMTCLFQFPDFLTNKKTPFIVFHNLIGWSAKGYFPNCKSWFKWVRINFINVSLYDTIISARTAKGWYDGTFPYETASAGLAHTYCSHTTWDGQFLTIPMHLLFSLHYIHIFWSLAECPAFVFFSRKWSQCVISQNLVMFAYWSLRSVENNITTRLMYSFST